MQNNSGDSAEGVQAKKKAIRYKSIGFKEEDIGTDSTISAAAIPMFLDNVKIFFIMLVGIWYSD